jgi:metal-dependent amidase/aminoacylase/carboxypeptidase family protein
VSVVGTPAEETVGGKVLLARSGLFDEFDAAMMVHPSFEDRTDTTSLACNGMEVTFLGVASHAVAHPEKGVNALQPLLRLFAEVEAARPSWEPDVKAPGVILEGGVRANIVPERAVAQFTVRGATIDRVRGVWRHMESMVERLAGEVGARFEIHPTDEPYFEMVTNVPLAHAYRANLAMLGRSVVDGPRPSQGSLDMGNVSHVCPSIHPFVRICPPEMASHTREFGEASVSPEGERALLDSVKAMAMSAADLLSRPELVREVRQAFDEFRQANRPQPGEAS